MSQLDIKAECKIHNHFIVERYIGEEKIGEEICFNVVCDQAYGDIFEGRGLPTFIALGKGSGTPAATDTKLFNEISYWSATYTDEQDIENQRITRTLKYTLAPEQYPGQEVTEIGTKGPSGKLYTHSMITDNNGTPVTLIKGDLERWYITAIVYMDYSLDLPTESKIIVDKAIFTEWWSSILVGKKPGLMGWFCNKPKGFPIGSPVKGYLSNSSSVTTHSFSFGYNATKKALVFSTRFTTQASSDTFEYFCICHDDRRYYDSRPDYQNSSIYGIPMFMIPISEFDDVNKPYTLYNQEFATGDGVKTTWRLPYALKTPANLKIYKRGQLVPSSEYTLKKKNPVVAQNCSSREYYKCGERYFTMGPGTGDSSTSFTGYIQRAGFFWYKWNADKTELVLDEIIPLDTSIQSACNRLPFENGVFRDLYNRLGAYDYWVVNPLTGKLMWKMPKEGYTNLQQIFCISGKREFAPDMSWVSNGYGKIYLNANMEPTSMKDTQNQYNQTLNIIDTSIYPPKIVQGDTNTARIMSPTYETYTTETYKVGNVRWIHSQHVAMDVSNIKNKEVTFIKYDETETTELKRIVVPIPGLYSTAYETSTGVCYLAAIDMYYLQEFKNTSSSGWGFVWLDWEEEKAVFTRTLKPRVGGGTEYGTYYRNGSWGLISNQLDIEISSYGDSISECYYRDVEFHIPPAVGDNITYDIIPEAMSKDGNWDLTTTFSLGIGR